MVNLETALEKFSIYITGRIPDKSVTAIAITETPEQRLSDYISDELTGSLLNNAGLRIVSRQDFLKLFSEQETQASLSFSDESTAKIGKNLGWQTIIFGEITPIWDTYRLSLRAVEVETGELQGTKNYLLTGNDPILICLINPNITIQQLNDRKSILQPFDGDQNNFDLKIYTDKAVYYDNEMMYITLSANEDCYFVVYHIDVYNNMQVIYPNIWERNGNFLSAGISRIIPEGSSYMMQAPYGEERILVYASEKPISIPDEQYVPRSISSDYLASPEALWHIDNGETEGLADELNADGNDTLIAEMPDNEGSDTADAGESPETGSAVIAENPESNISANGNFTKTNEKGTRGLMVTPRGATAQISYTILPK